MIQVPWLSQCLSNLNLEQDSRQCIYFRRRHNKMTRELTLTHKYDYHVPGGSKSHQCSQYCPLDHEIR